MSVKMRQQVEREIATAVIRAALNNGMTFGLENGEGEEIRADNETDILAAMFQTDDEVLYLYRPSSDKPFGWVQFVYGNDGPDAISDYSVNLESLLADAHKVSEKYSD